MKNYSKLKELIEEFGQWIVLADSKNQDFYNVFQVKLKDLIDNIPVEYKSEYVEFLKNDFFSKEMFSSSNWPNTLGKLGDLLDQILEGVSKSKNIGSKCDFPSAVDRDIYEQFLLKLDSTQEEIERLILNFEKQKNIKDIEILKGIIHTLKGEAGVVGIYDLEKLCHIIEDHLESGKISPDFLFLAKDWVGKKREVLRGEKIPLLSIEEIEDLCQAAKGNVHDAKVIDTETLDLHVCGDLSLIQDFIEESREHIQNSENNLLKLERDYNRKDAVHAIFRSYHTIKGISSFLNLNPITQLSHAIESLLAKYREEEPLCEEVINLLFEGNDKFLAELHSLELALAGNKRYTCRKDLGKYVSRLSELHIKRLPQDAIAVQVPDVQKARSENETYKNLSPKEMDSINLKEVIKVDVNKIDNLIEIIGELVIAESMVFGELHMNSTATLELQKNLGQLNKITKSLQEIGMSMRLVSIRSTFQKMERVVRDISKKNHKEILLITSGSEIELDKNIIEHLGDPLIHMVRNSADHGIEEPEVRTALGKPPEGKIFLRAFQEGGNIIIEVEDDGAGLDLSAITKKAIQQKLIPKDHKYTAAEISQLIFSPGFSTAEKITNISGRGVGMDVVKKNIELIRGKIDVYSEPGRGSKFTLKLPLTLAIMDGLVVETGGERFIIPTLSVIESFKLSNANISSLPNGSKMLEYRNKVIPVFPLGHLLDVDASRELDDSIVVVVEDTKRQIGLVVENLIGQQQTVIKNLGNSFGKIPGLAGAAIMADGSMMLIIDIPGLVGSVDESVRYNSACSINLGGADGRGC